jgi:hypothetical protein
MMNTFELSSPKYLVLCYMHVVKRHMFLSHIDHFGVLRSTDDIKSSNTYTGASFDSSFKLLQQSLQTFE